MAETPQQYTQRILSHVEGQDALKSQRATSGRLKKATRGLTPKQMKWKPEPGKWSIAEILAHLADVEVVVGWRMRSMIGANGVTTQPFDQDVWASVFRYNDRDAKYSVQIFSLLRDYNLAMLRALPAELWDNYGMHQERGKETVAHVTRLIAGHDLNHLKQIEGIAEQLKKKKKRR